MKLTQGLHLAYCTNIHRGETWAETFEALQRYTLAVRDRVSPGKRYAIGLRLSDQASRDLNDKKTLLEFQRWLEKERCYIFTINGFPYGQFHGTRVKEQVYAPDWTTPERLEYTKRLFALLAELAQEEGSVSTVPCSYKEFIKSPEQEKSMRDNLWKCVEYIADLSDKTDIDLHLGLEPEPLCYLETSDETVQFIERMREDRPRDERLERRLGVNYDTCHLAVEYEAPAEAIARFRDFGVRISKLHLSSALKLRYTAEAREALHRFAEDVYFHQVIERNNQGGITRFKDLDLALREAAKPDGSKEWRIHFHIPLHHEATPLFGNTADHMLGVLDCLKADPSMCRHLEMETYTWEIMPSELKQRNVVDQLAAEYDWALKHLAARGFTRAE
jgi:hypothetical protein